MVITHAMNAFDRNIRDGAQCACRNDEVEYVLTASVIVPGGCRNILFHSMNVENGLESAVDTKAVITWTVEIVEHQKSLAG